MREILESQKKHIEATVAHYERPELQMKFAEFDLEQKRQLDDDRRYWHKRLNELERELEAEPERVRALYEVKAQRIEPVGLVYLWPTR